MLITTSMKNKNPPVGTTCSSVWKPHTAAQSNWRIYVLRLSQRLLINWGSSLGFLCHEVVICSEVSEECAAYIFRVTELVCLDAQTNQSKEFSHPEDGGSTFLWNIRTFNHYMAQKLKRSIRLNIHNYNFTCYYEWVWNLVSHPVRTNITCVWESGVEDSALLLG